MGNTKIRILLVEDSRIVARYLTQLLELEDGTNLEIVHTERLADAADVLQQRDFDVVLLDLSLPDSTGTNTVIRARSLSPRTPIVVMSSDDDADVRSEAVRAGADAYLIKGDASAKMIVETIQQAVENHRRAP